MFCGVNIIRACFVSVSLCISLYLYIVDVKVICWCKRLLLKPPRMKCNIGLVKRNRKKKVVCTYDTFTCKLYCVVKGWEKEKKERHRNNETGEGGEVPKKEGKSKKIRQRRKKNERKEAEGKERKRKERRDRRKIKRQERGKYKKIKSIKERNKNEK